MIHNGIKFSVATNFDHQLLENIAPFGTIESVYGKLAVDPFGGGRPSVAVPHFNKKHLEDHIDIAHKNGIKFHYPINAMCMDNKEFRPKSHKKLLEFVDYLSNIGVDGVVVAIPYLSQLIKNQFPHLTVSISLYSGIDNITNVKDWISLGADEITLEKSYNRNLKKLKQILDRTKNVKFRLIPNNSCLHLCPFRWHHSLAISHATQAHHDSCWYIPYYEIVASYHRIKNPVHFLSSYWTRPEDIGFYEEIGKNRIIVKLTDRQRTTDWLTRCIKAYSERRYDGNLLDVVNYIGMGKLREKHLGKMFIKAMFEGVKVTKFKNLEKAIFNVPVYIDNNKLNGFLDGIKNKECNELECDNEGWIGEEGFEKPKSGKCQYCKEWAVKVLKIDPNIRKESMRLCEELINEMVTSDFFIPKKVNRFLGFFPACMQRIFAHT